MKIFVQQVIFLIIFNISFGQCRTPSEHVDSYFDAEQNCLHQYTLRIGSITKEVRADSLLCLKEADIQLESDMFEILQEPMKQCSSPELGIKDYFECFEDIAPANRKKLKKITSEKVLLWQNIDEVQQNKTACLSKASSKGNYESTTAVFSLNNCLQSISQQDINSVKESILVENPSPPGDMNEFLNKLDVIKEQYNKLKNCTLKENNNFDNCFREAKEEGVFFWDVRDRLVIRNSTQYFSKITEIDEADDSCLRQYIVMMINHHFKFDLERCLMHGSKQSQESEENLEKDKKLIADLIKEYKQFNKCRDITEDLNIYNCVYDKFWFTPREIQAAISRKSERNFESFKTTFLSSYTDQYPCIENLYDNLQFEGYNLGSMGEGILLDCLSKGYKLTATLPFEKQLIKELNKIQQFLKTCTEHRQTPGYEKCFNNVMRVYDTTLEYLQDENSNYSGIVAKHDMLHDTCFEDIVKDMIKAANVSSKKNLLVSQKCLFP